MDGLTARQITGCLGEEDLQRVKNEGWQFVVSGEVQDGAEEGRRDKEAEGSSRHLPAACCWPGWWEGCGGEEEEGGGVLEEESLPADPVKGHHLLDPTVYWHKHLHWDNSSITLQKHLKQLPEQSWW